MGDLGELRRDKLEKIITKAKETVKIAIRKLHDYASYGKSPEPSSKATSQGAVSKTSIEALLDNICNVVRRKRDQILEILHAEYIDTKEDLGKLNRDTLEKIITNAKDTVKIEIRKLHDYASYGKSPEPSSKATSQGAVSKNPFEALLGICNVVGRKRDAVLEILEAELIENKEDLAKLPRHILNGILEGLGKPVLADAIRKMYDCARGI